MNVNTVSDHLEPPCFKPFINEVKTKKKEKKLKFQYNKD